MKTSVTPSILRIYGISVAKVLKKNVIPTFCARKIKTNRKKSKLWKKSIKKCGCIPHTSAFQNYLFRFNYDFLTGSQVSPTPSFLNILWSTSLNITVECTWQPSSLGSCSSAFLHFSSRLLNMESATSTSSV